MQFQADGDYTDQYTSEEHYHFVQVTERIHFEADSLRRSAMGRYSAMLPTTAPANLEQIGARSLLLLQNLQHIDPLLRELCPARQRIMPGVARMPTLSRRQYCH